MFCLHLTRAPVPRPLLPGMDMRCFGQRLNLLTKMMQYIIFIIIYKG